MKASSIKHVLKQLKQFPINPRHDDDDDDDNDNDGTGNDDDQMETG